MRRGNPRAARRRGWRYRGTVPRYHFLSMADGMTHVPTTVHHVLFSRSSYCPRRGSLCYTLVLRLKYGWCGTRCHCHVSRAVTWSSSQSQVYIDNIKNECGETDQEETPQSRGAISTFCDAIGSTLTLRSHRRRRSHATQR